MQLHFDLVLTPGFRTWLTKNRPGVLRECQRQNVERIPVTTFFNPTTGLVGRYRLEFPFKHDTIAEGNHCDFDRQIDTDQATVVLDQHPYRLERTAEVTEQLVKPKADSFAPGDPLILDAYDLTRLANGKPVMVLTRVKERKGWFLELETIPGQTVTVDVDELRCWHNYYQLQEKP